MKINIKDFRCYEDATFDFGNGLVLISAKSGQGKSSIFMAINFALFGTGTKVIMYGKNSCKVELEFDDIKIIRTKKPNRLLVNDIYEDDVGQNIINKKFGNTFDVTGYIAQNAINSFIMMSPIEKLNFLEKFAFRDVDLSIIKKKCKDIIDTRYEHLVSINSKLELTTNMLKEIKKPIQIEFPIKCSTKQQDKVIKNEEIKYKNCNILIKKSKIFLKNTETKFNDLKILINSNDINQNIINDLEIKIKNLMLEKNNIKYEGDDFLENMNKKLKSIISKRELNILKKSYKEDILRIQEIKEEELSILTTELENIENTLWKDYNKTDIEEIIKEYKQTLNYIEKVSILKNNLKKYNNIENEFYIEKDLEDNINKLNNYNKILEKYNLQKDVYKCPSCNNNLKIKNNSLYICDIENIDDICDIENINNHIKETTLKIKKLENKLLTNTLNKDKKNELEKEINDIISLYENFPEEKEINEDLEYIQKYNIDNNRNEKKKIEIQKKIKNQVFSSSLSNLQYKADNKLQQITELEKYIDNNNQHDIEEKELIKNIKQQEEYKIRYEHIINNLEEANKQISKNTKNIENDNLKYIEKYDEINDINFLKNIIQEEEQKIKDLEDKKKSCEESLKNIEKYKKYKEENEKYQEWISKIDFFEKEEKIIRDLYKASLLMKDKISEAESIALSNMISSINIHVQLYLDCFFIDNPISVRLSAFKENKKNVKPQINVEVEYKGMECDLYSLSGGEIARVILAFTLGLGEIFNVPLLLLDESTASLDQDITTTVFSTIKENFKGKLLLSISHNVIEGIFDKTIKL